MVAWNAVSSIDPDAQSRAVVSMDPANVRPIVIVLGIVDSGPAEPRACGWLPTAPTGLARS